MQLYIAGGVGEHGRNCFYVQGGSVCFMVDCGVMADSLTDKYPHLSQEQIDRLDVVFLTHSHADHTGALMWLKNRGFCGPIVAAQKTLRQLPQAITNFVELETVCPSGSGSFKGLLINWGRSGHCAGGVWYRFAENEKSILFSGDYTENTQVYACDAIRGVRADAAVLDCAYGRDDTSYTAACEHLVSRTEKLLQEHGLLIFPVPKCGRGLELLRLFESRLADTRYYADELFLQNLEEMKAGGFWYRQGNSGAVVSLYKGLENGIVFISDPQLRTEKARKKVKEVLALGGKAVMTGTTESGSLSEKLIKLGRMELLRYPVHQNYTQYRKLTEQNHFGKTIAYHSPDFSATTLINL